MSSLDFQQLLSQIGVAFLLLYAVVYLRSNQSRRSKLPLPPTPKGHLIFGNALQLPKSNPGEGYMRLCNDLNSDIIHLNALGQPVIILNSIHTIHGVLEKHSLVTSNRPKSWMMADETLVGWDDHVVLIQHNDLWRATRKLLHSQFQEGAVVSYRPEIKRSVDLLLKQLLTGPEGFLEHIHHFGSRTAVSIIYGLDILPSNDPYVHLIDEANLIAMETLLPGSFLVEIFPLLRFIPSWFPGGGFKRTARQFRKVVDRAREEPFGAAKERISKGLAKPSLVLHGLTNLEDPSNLNTGILGEDKVAGAALGMYSAAAESTSGFLSTFILAMLVYPEVQKTAQMELDRVIQHGFLPSFEDEKSLPYLGAIVKEVLRWNPVAVIGVPHVSTEEVIYRGYRIPKGSVVVGNIWGAMRDQNTYPEAETFNPSRFLGPNATDVPDPRHYVFGAGRRKCPGNHLALASLYLSFACILTTFDITPLEGQEPPPVKFEEFGISHHPVPFKCCIIPRSKETVKLIESAGFA